MKRLLTLALVLILLLCAGCSQSPTATSTSSSSQPALTILSGSENKTLEPIINDFAAQNHIQIRMRYSGSVDIMRELSSGKIDADAVWPSNSIWLSIGDTAHRVKEAQSIMWSPVVLAVKTPVAKRLGWVGKNVAVEDILAAAKAGKLHFMMTSATQSNSGACAYLGFLSAFAGAHDVLGVADLHKPQVRQKIKEILGHVDRSSGSSGWLKDLFLDKYDQYDAMVNYESLAIEADQALTANGKAPLYVVYPSDGLAIADSPLGYVDNGDQTKRSLFEKLQAYLLSDPIQRKILGLGRRVGPVGAQISGTNPSVFNPAWGLNLNKFLNQVKYPKASVILQALNLYQTTFRKPSYTVFVLDFSGSMLGDRENHLKAALGGILDQKKAAESLLQASPDDVVRVIAFSDHILDEWKISGNDPNEYDRLYQEVESLTPDGGTDIYTPVMSAIQHIRQENAGGRRFPAVVLMTDGESNTGMTFDQFEDAYKRAAPSQDIPVYSVLFGDASEQQLKDLSASTSGQEFNGVTDLEAAFRSARGYN